MTTQNGICDFRKRRSALLHNQMSSVMCEFLDSGQFTDMVLHVKDGTIPCHRVVLAAASPYIRAILEQHDAQQRKVQVGQVQQMVEQVEQVQVREEYKPIMRNPRQTERQISRDRQLGQNELSGQIATQSQGHATGQAVVNLKKSPKVAASAVVHYIYHGEIHISWQYIRDVIYLAELLGLKEIHQDLLRYTMIHTLPNNCLNMFFFSLLSPERMLLKTCAEMVIAQHFQEVIGSPSFQNLRLNQLLDLMSHGMSFMTSQSHNDHEVHLKACIRWILFNKRDRRKHFSEILDKIDLSRCSLKYLLYLRDKCNAKLAIQPGTYQRINKEIAKQKAKGSGSGSVSSVYVLGGIAMNQTNEGCQLNREVLETND